MACEVNPPDFPVVLPERFGELPDGRAVTRYTIGGSPGVELKVLDIGAIVQELWVSDRGGTRANVVLGSADLAGYLASPHDFYGAVVGRVANRIARAELPVGGAVYRLLANDGRHMLHGGPDGFHRRLWDVIHFDDATIRLQLISPDGDQGFPGQLTATVEYQVRQDEVTITYTATTTATTAVNLTQHAHFNLGGESTGSIDDHTLQVNAIAYTPASDDLIPTGELTGLDGTALDLRVPKALGALRRSNDPAIQSKRGLDHNYVLGGSSAGPAAVLVHPVSGRRLEIRTDQPGLQVYTGNFFDGTHQGTGGHPYQRGAGVALETQGFPDAVHHEGRPCWPSILLKPGSTLQTWTRWRLPPAT
jgi:aldose 1-epimerase